MQLRGVGFAGAVGLAAGAAGGGDAARQQGALAGEDDFGSLYLDSTAVKANTERPTDSGLITKLVERICRRGGKLDLFGLPNFEPSGLEELQRDMRRMHREIGFSTGKPKKQGKVKKITGAEEWNRPDYRAARANRSAVESLMFTLKDGYEFGRLLRRERENVRAELTEKVLANNLSQMIRVRARRAREKLEQFLAA